MKILILFGVIAVLSIFSVALVQSHAGCTRLIGECYSAALSQEFYVYKTVVLTFATSISLMILGFSLRKLFRPKNF